MSDSNLTSKFAPIRSTISGIGKSMFHHQPNTQFEPKRHQKGKCGVYVWSSLADDVYEECQRLRSAFGVQDIFPIVKIGDMPLQRSVHRGSDHGKHVGVVEIEENDLLEMLADRTEVFLVQAPDGTGMIVTKAAEPFRGEPLEAITSFLTITPRPTDYEKVCRAFNLAALNPRRNHLCTNKADRDEIQGYPRKIAKMQLSAAFIDSQNLFRAAALHREVTPRDHSTTRDEIRRQIRGINENFGSPPKEYLGFDPSVWVVDESDLDGIEIWADNATRVHVIGPPEYDERRLTRDLFSGSDEIEIHYEPGPVPEIQLLGVRRLSSDFIATIRTTWIQWLYQNAPNLDAWNEELEKECIPGTDPQEEVVRFLVEELGVTDETVLSTLREVGADV